MGSQVSIRGEGFARVVDGSVEVTTSIQAFQKQPLSRGVEVVAYDTNVSPVYISRRKNVTADESNTGGFRLIPGSSVFVPSRNLGEVYFVGATADLLSFMAY